jgi:hypothetical protein
VQKKRFHVVTTTSKNARFTKSSKDNRRNSWHIKEKILHYNKKYYILSEQLRRELLKQNHDDSQTKHFEYDKFLKLLRWKYYWFSMLNDVQKYIDTCTICIQVKFTRHKSYELLQSLSILNDLRKDWIINFIIDLFSSKHREVVYDNILIVIDKFIKYARYISTRKNWTIEHLTNVMFDEVFIKIRYAQIYRIKRKLIIVKVDS